jgi:hypothetical protein
MKLEGTITTTMPPEEPATKTAHLLISKDNRYINISSPSMKNNKPKTQTSS